MGFFSHIVATEFYEIIEEYYFDQRTDNQASLEYPFQEIRQWAYWLERQSRRP